SSVALLYTSRTRPRPRSRLFPYTTLFRSRGSGPRVVGNFLLQVRHGVRETGEIVELAGGKAVMERVDVVDQELLGTVLVLGEVPDDIAIHHVLGGDAAHRAAQRPRDHDLALNRKVLALGLTRDGDGVRNVRDAPGEHGLVVGWWRPGEDLGCFRFLVQSLHVLQRLDRVFGVDRDVSS